MSQSLSPQGRRPSHSRRPPTHRICDFGPEHISVLAHNLATEDLETANQQLRRKLSEKDEELLKYHSELGEVKTQLEEAQARYAEAKKVFEVAKESEEEYEQEVEALEKERDDYKKSLEEYKAALDKANLNIREVKKKRDESEKQLAIRITEHDQARTLLQKRSRSAERLSVENKRLARESQDVSKRLTELVGPEWNSGTTQEALDLLKKQLDEVTTSRNEAQATVASIQIQLEEANRRAEIKQAITPEPESDLSALTDLHPALSKAKHPTAKQLADSLVEAITFDLNDIWSHLPHQQEEALVTPSTRRIDIILNRLKEAVKKDANLKLAPELAQAKIQIRDLTVENKQYKDTLQRNTQEGVNQRIKPVLGLFPGSEENLVLTPQGVAKRIQTLVQNATKAIIALAPKEFRTDIETVGAPVPNHFQAVQDTVRKLAKNYNDWQKFARNLEVKTPLEASNFVTLLNSQLQDALRKPQGRPEEIPVVTVTPTTPTTLEDPIKQLETLIDLLRTFLP